MGSVCKDLYGSNGQEDGATGMIAMGGAGGTPVFRIGTP